MHWSSYIFKKGPRLTEIYSSTSGWEMFQCPALDRGGLPPTNPAADNFDAGQSAQAAGYIDQQAPRLSYTVNEAIIPRNKFIAQQTVDGVSVTIPEHCVRAGSVRHSSETILATEFTQSWQAVSSMAGADGNTSLCKSHRPVHGFY